MQESAEPRPGWPSPSKHSTRYAQINDLLSRPQVGLPFPPGLEQAFRRAHAAESAATFRANVFYVLLLYIALGVGIMAIVPFEQLDRWPLGYLALGVIIIAAVILSRRDILSEHYDSQIGAIAFAGMALVIGLPAMISDPLMTQVSMIGIIHAVVVIGAILGLRFVPACVAMWGGGISGLLVLGMLNAQHDWLMLHQTFTGGCLIGMFLAWVAEKRSRQVFLQKSLLALEKQRSDRLAEQMQQMSREDGLTGLANRRHFDEVLAREWLRGQRDGSALSLMFIDVDHFKRFNDQHGHQIGDDCLRKIADTLKEFARRPGDMAARYGGEEFVMIYPQTGPEALREIAEQIREAVSELGIIHQHEGRDKPVTISVGLATMLPEASSQPEQLVERADHALYQAKRQGRDRVVMG